MVIRWCWCWCAVTGGTLSWLQQVPHYSHKYQVITVDLRGFKHSKCAPEAVHPRFFPNFLVVSFISAVLLSLGFQRLANRFSRIHQENRHPSTFN